MGHILYMSTVGLAAGGRGERRKRAAQQASPRSLLHAGKEIHSVVICPVEGEEEGGSAPGSVSNGVLVKSFYSYRYQTSKIKYF